MFCKNCGHNCGENEKFCPACGTPIADTPAQTPAAVTPEPPVQPVPPVQTEAPVQPEAPAYVPVQPETPAYTAPADAEPAPKKSKKGLVAIIIAVVAVLVVAGVVVAGFMTQWFGLAKPAHERLTEAFDATMSADNCTVTAEEEYTSNGYTSKSTWTGYVTDEGDYRMYITSKDESGYGDESGTETVYIEEYVVDEDDNVYEVYKYDDDTAYGYVEENDDFDVFDNTYSTVIDLTDLVVSMMNGDGEYLYNNLGSDYFDYDKLEDITNDFAEKRTPEEWEEYFGMTVEKKDGQKVYSFSIDMAKLQLELMEYAESEDALDSSYSDEYEAEKESLEGYTGEFKLTVTMDDGYIVAASCDAKMSASSDEASYEYEISSTVTFSDFGKTKIDADKAEEIVNEATELAEDEDDYSDDDYTYDEDYEYPVDEEISDGAIMEDTSDYGYCEYCDTYGELTWDSICDMYLCDDCYLNFWNCDSCGQYTYTHYNSADDAYYCATCDK